MILQMKKNKRLIENKKTNQQTENIIVLLVYNK